MSEIKLDPYYDSSKMDYEINRHHLILTLEQAVYLRDQIERSLNAIRIHNSLGVDCVKMIVFYPKETSDE